MATGLVGPAIPPDHLVRDGVFSIHPAMHSGRSGDLLNVGALMAFAFRISAAARETWHPRV
ncbi:MAG: hypothetical protein OXF88_11435 [Rhodobacteraceae bacterium]|nr:hypothetical protein [Paracoccaceae bacterium]MCY4141581.1 hypothetical protein [Paracoccaceae bacterium]